MPDRFIEKASDCNIIKFRKCKFDEDYTCLILEGNPSVPELRSAFYNIFIDYIDTSGLAWDSTEKLLIKKQARLEGRQFVINSLLFVNDMSLRTYNVPHFKSLELFEPHGYQLTWQDDVNDFKQQLENIKSSQMSYDADLIEAKQQLKKHRDSLKKDPHSPNDSENSFLDMLNNLELVGNKIDEEKLSVARLALMIKRYLKMTDKPALHKSKN